MNWTECGDTLCANSRRYIVDSFILKCCGSTYVSSVTKYMFYYAGTKKNKILKRHLVYVLLITIQPLWFRRYTSDATCKNYSSNSPPPFVSTPLALSFTINPCNIISSKSVFHKLSFYPTPTLGLFSYPFSPAAYVHKYIQTYINTYYHAAVIYTRPLTAVQKLNWCKNETLQMDEALTND